MLAARCVDQMTPGQGDKGSQPRSLGADRLLGDLDDDFLSTLELLLDRKTRSMTPITAPPALLWIARRLTFDNNRCRLDRPVAHFKHRCNAFVECWLALRHDRLGFDVTLADNFGDRAETFRVGLEIGNMKKARLVEPDVDERRLHPGQHPGHFALINVTRQAAALIALKIKFR